MTSKLGMEGERMASKPGKDDKGWYLNWVRKRGGKASILIRKGEKMVS